ncbi:MAG TPA: thioredoxin family protein [Woeseiaceae bacterium]|nr:thioredoxin family protein [Woeseiaceae bacterium]
MSKIRLPLIGAVLAGVVGVSIVTIAAKYESPESTALATVRLRDEGRFPTLSGATDWLNTPPLTTGDLRGKVVLIDFWTYTCINWLRTAPHIRAWAEKYKDQGLVVIGVHSPEFEFEKDIVNVRRAVSDLPVSFPVAVDSDHAIWRAFRNQYWPALYFIDATGHIRYHHFGEGGFVEAERVIQQLLDEAGAVGVSRELVMVRGDGIEAAADWDNLRSSENYLALGRTQKFASNGVAVRNRPQTYAAPGQLRLNHWALAGNWAMRDQAVVLHEAGGRITYRFHARDLHLVMKPSAAGKSVRFRILLDGQPPGAAHGADVDEQGNGTATEPRLYQLIRQPGAIDDRLFEIEFLDPGIEAFAFTFG